MERYRNLSGDSNVANYEIGIDYIKVEFKDGSLYLYNHSSTGKPDIDQMKKLALSGEGLNSFINTKVKKRYAAKLR